MCMWYEIRFQFNPLSKVMQSNDMELDSCIGLLQKVQEFPIQFKADGFTPKLQLAGWLKSLK